MNTAILGRRSAHPDPQAEPCASAGQYRGAVPRVAEPAPASLLALQTVAGSGVSECASHMALLRTALVMGLAAVAIVAWLAVSGAAPSAEPELTALLRGMAAIKGLLALSAAGLVWWRLGQPAPLRVAATYIACVWTFVVCAVLIWKLAFIVTAAVLFHGAALIGSVLAMREGRQMPRR